MNWLPPPFIREAAAAALDNVETNHYAIPRGRIRYATRDEVREEGS